MVTFIQRFFVQIFNGTFSLYRNLSKQDLITIEKALDHAETQTSSEIAFAVEEKISVSDLIKNKSARERAIELFASLRVWDTAENNGVLIYLLLSERNIEIIVDRGVVSVLSHETIESVCREIESSIAEANVCEGLLAGIKKLTDLLSPHFPFQSNTVRNVSNKPFI